METTDNTPCPRCNSTFSCGANTGKCWCCELPNIMPLDDTATSCYCPKCLTELIKEQKKPMLKQSANKENNLSG